MKGKLYFNLIIGVQQCGHTCTCGADAGEGPAEVREYCLLDVAGKNLVRSAMRQLGMSAHAFHRILKLARTIADPSSPDDSFLVTAEPVIASRAFCGEAISAMRERDCFVALLLGMTGEKHPG